MEHGDDRENRPVKIWHATADMSYMGPSPRIGARRRLPRPLP